MQRWWTQPRLNLTNLPLFFLHFPCGFSVLHHSIWKNDGFFFFFDEPLKNNYQYQDLKHRDNLYFEIRAKDFANFAGLIGCERRKLCFCTRSRTFLKLVVRGREKRDPMWVVVTYRQKSNNVVTTLPETEREKNDPKRWWAVDVDPAQGLRRNRMMMMMMLKIDPKRYDPAQGW